MNTTVYLNLLREALGVPPETDAAQILEQVRRLRAIHLRRVGHLGASRAYAVGIASVQHHIGRQVRSGHSQLDAAEVLKWLACILADAQDALTGSCVKQQSGTGSVIALPGVDARHVGRAGHNSGKSTDV